MRGGGLEPWIVIAIPLVVITIGLLLGFTRRGTVAGTRIGDRRIELRAPGDPAAVFARLMQMVGRYKIDDSDAQAGMLVYSSPPSFATWGFFYPVAIVADGTGSRIAIGVQSKFFQWGPLVTRAHKQLVETIEQLLGIPAARVA